MPLVLVLDLEQRTSILGGNLRDYPNRLEILAVPPDVVVLYFLEDPPRFKLPIDSLVARSDAGLPPSILNGVARVVRALELVGGTDVALSS